MSLNQLLTELSTNMRIGNPIMGMWIDLRNAHHARTGELLNGALIAMTKRMQREKHW